MLYISYPDNKLMQNKGYINAKRGVNSVAKPWIEFNYNIVFEINCKVIDKIFILYNTPITKNRDV